MTTVHITDESRMLIEGLTTSINESGIARVTGVSHTLAKCREALLLQVPDVLLIDLNLPDSNGIDFCAEIAKHYPQVKILILTTYYTYSIAKRVMDDGASGYILKNSLTEEVIAGIETVVNGEIFLCDEIDILLKKTKETPVRLTGREKELLRLIVDGYTNREIANKMTLAVETIKTYRKNLILKLGARNSVVLAKKAIEEKFI
ncbi:MAG: response regulator transcription factor [Tannerellaceae bacterium]|jgi:DNA-binding NarL/FixJ family response regulator|nr:response regulator transcription factor [Tannerellaceae bacterium]